MLRLTSIVRGGATAMGVRATSSAPLHATFVRGMAQQRKVKPPQPAKPKPAAPMAAAKPATPAAAAAPAPPKPTTPQAAASTSSSSFSASFSPDEDAALSRMMSPDVRARLAEPGAAQQLQSMFADSARMEAMLSNPMARRAMASMNPEMGRFLESEEGRNEMIRQMRALAGNPAQVQAMAQQVQQKARDMEATPAASPKATPSPPKPAPAAAATATATASPSTPSAASPSSSSSSSSASSRPTGPETVLDPKLRAQLADPAFRAQLQQLVSNPTQLAQLERMLANPLVRKGLSLAAGGGQNAAMMKALEDPVMRQRLLTHMQQLAAPGALDAQIDAAVQASEAVEQQQQQPSQRVSAEEAAEAHRIIAEAERQARERFAQAAAPAVASTPSATQTVSAATESVSPPSPPSPPSSGGSGGSGGSSGSLPPSPPQPEAEKTSFWRSSWIDIALGVLCGVLLFRVGAFLLDRPPVLSALVEAAEEDELVRAKVGTPIKLSYIPGYSWTGNVTEENAQVVLPISGPLGSATLHARALFDQHFKVWKIMVLQLGDIDGVAQKHTLPIPDRFVIKPRYVSPEEAQRIKKKYDDMQAKMEAIHAKKPAQGHSALRDGAGAANPAAADAEQQQPKQ